MPYVTGISARVKRITFPIDHERYIHIAKSPYDKIMKTTEILCFKIVDSWIPKLVIVYESKTRSGGKPTSKGVIQLYDIGPAPTKKEPKAKK